MKLKCIRASLVLATGERVVFGQEFDAGEPYAHDYLNGNIAVRVIETPWLAPATPPEPTKANEEPVPEKKDDPVEPEDDKKPGKRGKRG